MPPWLKQARTRVRYADNTGVSRSQYNGDTRTASFGGDRLAASIEFTTQGGKTTRMERAALIAFLARLRGRQNRAYLFDSANRIRGSFPATELLSNNTFSDSTTGWSVDASVLTVADRALRATANGASNVFGFTRSSVAVTQYSPYVMRVMFGDGRLMATSLSAYIHDSIAERDSTALTSLGGLASIALVSPTATLTSVGAFNSGSGETASSFFNVPYASLSRCALVDNGGNAFLQSDTLATTWATTKVSVSSNGTTSPDQALTADVLVEDNTAGTHFIGQTATKVAVAEDWCGYGFFKRNGGRNVCLFVGHGGSNVASCIFDLTNGTAGTVTNGGTITRGRAFICAAGNGWYFCALVAQLTSSTTASVEVAMVNGAGAVSYTGDGTSLLSAWRVGGARSGVPTRGAQTTGTALASGSSQSGSGLCIKGLPASTNQLLLPADQFEVITSRGSELKIVTTALNSDAAGLGYLQFEPPLRGAAADNAPVIVHEPMGRFIFAGEAPEWSNEPGVFTTASADFEEA